MIPVITFMGMMFAEVLAGSIVVEQGVFTAGFRKASGYRNQLQGLSCRPGNNAFIAFIVILMNFLVDIAYKRLDARIEE